MTLPGLRPKPALFGHCRALCRVARRRHWVIRRQFPAGAIIGNFKTMGESQMASEPPGAISALEADHIILLYRTSDWKRPLRLRTYSEQLLLSSAVLMNRASAWAGAKARPKAGSDPAP